MAWGRAQTHIPVHTDVHTKVISGNQAHLVYKFTAAVHKCDCMSLRSLITQLLASIGNL